MHDSSADIFAGTTEAHLSAKRASEKTTQWRQCTIDTGSGGTEVKTSSNLRKIEETMTKSISMLNGQKNLKTGMSLTITFQKGMAFENCARLDGLRLIIPLPTYNRYNRLAFGQVA